MGCFMCEGRRSDALAEALSHYGSESLPNVDNAPPLYQLALQVGSWLPVQRETGELLTMPDSGAIRTMTGQQ